MPQGHHLGSNGRCVLKEINLSRFVPVRRLSYAVNCPIAHSSQNQRLSWNALYAPYNRFAPSQRTGTNTVNIQSKSSRDLCAPHCRRHHHNRVLHCGDGESLPGCSEETDRQQQGERDLQGSFAHNSSCISNRLTLLFTAILKPSPELSKSMKGHGQKDMSFLRTWDTKSQISVPVNLTGMFAGAWEN
jgi:hypothetical protein